MRTRRLRLWLVAASLLSFGSTYVSPIALSFRDSRPLAQSLPRLEVAVLGFPKLAAPKVAPDAAKRSTPSLGSVAAPSSGTPVAHRPAREAARPTVEVVTSSYTLVPKAKPNRPASAATAKKDPFADVPVVTDSVGAIPPPLPATPEITAPTTPPEVESSVPSEEESAPTPRFLSMVSSEPEAAETAADEPVIVEAESGAESPEISSQVESEAEIAPQIAPPIVEETISAAAPESQTIESVPAPDVAPPLDLTGLSDSLTESSSPDVPDELVAAGSLPDLTGDPLGAIEASDEGVTVQDVAGPDAALAATTGTTGTTGGTSGTAGPEAGAADDESPAATAPEGTASAPSDPAAVPGSGRSPPGPQVIHLELGGATGVTYEGPVTVTGIDVPAYSAPAPFAGQEAAIAAALGAEVERLLAGEGAVVTLVRPASGDYSTIYVGGTSAAFAEYGRLFGISEQVDEGNTDANDIAFVFSEQIPTFARTLEDYVADLAGYVAHEAGHLLGFEHMRTAHSYDGSDVLGEVAFKPFTHVEIAKDVRNDLIEDGKLDISGRRP
ncbi:MAG: hypothetical protein WD981_02595, partial [Gaiellaceae bacterium]